MVPAGVEEELPPHAGEPSVPLLGEAVGGGQPLLLTNGTAAEVLHDLDTYAELEQGVRCSGRCSRTATPVPRSKRDGSLSQ